jgi:hypothetical protein
LGRQVREAAASSKACGWFQPARRASKGRLAGTAGWFSFLSLEQGMKGRAPWIKRDVRRRWECPICGRIVRTDGIRVNQPCDCLAKNDPTHVVWMRLVETDEVRQMDSSI